MKREKRGMRLRVYFVLMVISVAAAAVLGTMLGSLIFRSFAFWAELLFSAIFCLLFSGGVVVAFTEYLLHALNHLRRAMDRVSAGDFSVRLTKECAIWVIRELYQNFNTMAAELAATEILQTDFVSNVSHEFKTPITAIEGYATLLHGDENLTAEQGEYAEKILFNTRRLSGLVGNILLLSKLDNQSIPSRRERYRLDEQLRQAIVSLEPKWTEKDIEFDAELEAAYFSGNEQLMFHVWLNLLDNAVKFSPAGGCICVRLGQEGGRVSVCVSDEGVGIPEEERKRIFDKFYQSDSSHKDEGNGLGLALVGRIVAIHRGAITVENNAGRGCTFTVTLPL